MSEARAGEAELPDVDSPSFLRFSEWLYTDRYQLPFSDATLQARKEAGPDLELAWDRGLSSKEKKKKEKEMRAGGIRDSRITQETVDEAAFCSVDPVACVVAYGKQELWNRFTNHADLGLQPPPRRHRIQPNLDWTNTLLGHARLCCFADMHGITALQKVCQETIRTALVAFECQEDQVSVLTQLIDYTICSV